MSSESDRSFTAQPPEAVTEASVVLSTERQPMQIYRPAPSPLPGNRPIADNVSSETDELLGYLD